MFDWVLNTPLQSVYRNILNRKNPYSKYLTDLLFCKLSDTTQYKIGKIMRFQLIHISSCVDWIRELEAYSEPFCECSYFLFKITIFAKKAPSEMFHSILNTPLRMHCHLLLHLCLYIEEHKIKVIFVCVLYARMAVCSQRYFSYTRNLRKPLFFQTILSLEFR